jgi:hypothetical protein
MAKTLEQRRFHRFRVAGGNIWEALQNAKQKLAAAGFAWETIEVKPAHKDGYLVTVMPKTISPEVTK